MLCNYLLSHNPAAKEFGLVHGRKKIRGQNQVKLECGPMPNVMAAQKNIGGAVCKSSIIPFLVRRHKVWLMAAARVPCSNAANIGEHKTWMQSDFCSWQNSVREQEPPKCIYSVPAQETVKHPAKFG